MLPQPSLLDQHSKKPSLYHQYQHNPHTTNCLPSIDQMSQSPMAPTMSSDSYFRNTLKNNHNGGSPSFSLPPLILPPITRESSYNNSDFSKQQHPGTLKLPSMNETLPELNYLISQSPNNNSLASNISMLTSNMISTIPHQPSRGSYFQIPNHTSSGANITSGSSSPSSNSTTSLPMSRSSTLSTASLPTTALSNLTQPSDSPNSPNATQVFDPTMEVPQTSAASKTRKRKKRPCPICNKLVSNLATHKSTHISQDEKPHVCSTCGRGFSRLNDLGRHERRHLKLEFETGNSNATDAESDESLSACHHSSSTAKCTIFKCPYWSSSNKPSNPRQPSPHCHATGLFSRCDTFKNHLKALHFQYPPGTLKRDRARVGGICKGCNTHWPSVDQWLDNHVLCEESGCKGKADAGFIVKV
ncbi:Stp4 protein [Saccharomycopsis crataegensis]|uniref:Stp4 protein n=1 Tax=Saccharomycopsis crataegensis TaxID=43959 RepID=A0AAV5QP08_9ASCO|nr:Stp4 protein [Saccharomycopsis crataegensis]